MRRELASAQMNSEKPMAVVPAAVPASRLDPAVEKRLLARATELVGVSEERQVSWVRAYLYEVGRDAERQRRSDGQTLSALKAHLALSRKRLPSARMVRPGASSSICHVALSGH